MRSSSQGVIVARVLGLLLFGGRTWIASCTPIDVKITVFGCVCANGPCDAQEYPAMGHAIDMAFEGINAFNFIPGYRIVHEVVDTACSATLGAVKSTELILQDTGQWPFGVLGPCCTGCTMAAAQTLNLAHVPQISIGATGTTLSSRSAFPSFFRSCLVGSVDISAWFMLMIFLGWNQVALFYDNVYGFASLPFVDEFLTTLNGSVVDVLQGTPDRLMLAPTPQRARVLLDKIIETRVRGILCNAYHVFVRQLICQMSLAGVKGMIGTHFSFFPPTFTLLPDTPCTTEQMVAQIRYWIYPRGRPFGPMTGWFTQPTPFNPNMTIYEFIMEYYARCDAGSSVGSSAQLDAAAAGRSLGGGQAADAAFMMALTLKSMLERGYTIHELTRMNESTFSETVDVMQATSFYGISGPVNYPSDKTAYGASDRLVEIDYLQYQGVPGVSGGMPREPGTGDIIVATCFDPTNMGSVNLIPGQEFIFDEGYSMSSLPPALFELCVAGTSYNFSSSSCEACPDEMLYVAVEAQCRCKPGYYTSGDDCVACDSGTYSPQSGETACMNCALGKYANMSGLSQCSTCPVGSFASTPGMSNCQECGEGRGTSELWTTLQAMIVDGSMQMAYAEGSTSNATCSCQYGTRLDGNGGCQFCGEGLICQGQGLITVLPGYYAQPMTHTGAEISVYKCHGGERRCKGGPPGETCASGREGISCAECMAGKSAADSGECVDCQGTDAAPFVGVCIIAVGVLVVLYYIVDTQDRANQSHALLTSAMSISVLITVVQQIGVFGQMNIEWEEPIATTLAIARLFALDIRILRMGCILSSPPVTRFLIQLFCVAVCVVLLVVIHAIFSLIRRRESGMASLIGSIGAISMIFYISVVAAILGPFQCLKNPNGKWTVRAYQSITCWDENDDHTAMVIIGSFTVLIPLSYLAWCVMVVKQYPAQMARGNTRFLKAYAFLFFRYRPAMYGYGILHMVRSLLLAIVPVIHIIPAQIFCLTGLLIIYTVLTTYFLPWRVWLGNVVDIISSSGLLFLMSIIALLVKDDSASSQIAMLGTISILAFIFNSVIFIGWGVFVRLATSRKKEFGFFICHHKAGAGSFARLLKLTLTETVGKTSPVFVDCDDLTDLDRLFDYVASRTETIIVVCSKAILSRPWCIGEIVTANIHEIGCVTLLCDDFEYPAHDFIKDYLNHVPDISVLTEFGIQLDMIQKALRWLCERPSISIPRVFNKKSMQTVVNVLTKDGIPTGPVKVNYESEGDDRSDAAQTALIVDDTSFSALSTALVLTRMLLPHFTHNPEQLPVMVRNGPDLSPKFKKSLLLCTNGMLNNTQVINAIVTAGEAELALLPILGDETFQFPTSETVVQYRSSLSQSNFDEVSQTILDVFKAIAMVFTPAAYSANENTLQTQALNIATRLTRETSLRKVKSVKLSAGKVQKGSFSSDTAGVDPYERRLGSLLVL